MVNMAGMVFPPNFDSGDVDQAVDALTDNPEGMRWLLGTQAGNYIAQDGWVANRDNPHDRTIASTLTESISAENRTSIAVEALPYDLEDGHELVIQTGDPSNPPLRKGEDMIFAYVDGGAASGDTSIAIDDGNGNPVTITASSGDRVLSKWQSLWPIHAKGELKNMMQQYVQGFVDAGVDLDGIALDTELKIEATKGIKHDPRWDDPSKGFEDGVSMKEQLSPYTIDEAINGNTGGEWRREIDKRIQAEALTEAVFDPITQEFPDAKGSDWNQNGITEPEAKNAPNTDGKLTYQPYNFGTHGNYGLYGSARALAKKDLRNIDPDNQIPYDYGRSPWATLRWQVKFIRAMVRENDGAVQPWLPFRDCCGGGFYFNTLETRNYFREHWIQMMLHTDPEVPALYFNPGSASTDQKDLEVDKHLKEINEAVAGDSWTNVTSTDVAWTSGLIATAVDLPDRRLWRISVKRVDPLDGRTITVNVSNGDTVTIPGGEVGAWYETGLNESPTFSYTHPPVDNLLASDEWVDLTSDVWGVHPNPNGENPNVSGGHSDPDGGTNAYRVQDRWISNELSVEPDTQYTMSWWAKGGKEVVIHDPADLSWQNRVGRYVMGGGSAFADGDWHRGRIVFTVPSDLNTVVIEITGSEFDYRDSYFYQPMLNKGDLEGPYENPGASAGASQSLSLRKGGNLVSSAVQPLGPDLEAVLGSAAASIAKIETEDGKVFDPDTGTDEIGTWDSSEAYKIHAETPTSFSIEGIPLDGTEVSLGEGWNWLPYPDSTSVAINQALEPIQDDLVMVKDETGRVYRPAQGTDQIGSLEPGAAYKILLENPVTLSYPLE